MSARLLDGQTLARTIQEEIRPEVAAFAAQHGRPQRGLRHVRRTNVIRGDDTVGARAPQLVLGVV